MNHVEHLFDLLLSGRHATLSSLDQLSHADLHAAAFPGANTIGMLLAHINAVEHVTMCRTFLGRDLLPDEKAAFEPAFRLGSLREQMEPKPLESYVQDLNHTRNLVLKAFQARGEHWIDEISSPIPPHVVNATYWYHQAQDEAQHRGQILQIRRWLSAR